MGRSRSTLPEPQSLVRPVVRALEPYVPGEQPQVAGLIKLNTNENPYPPSPHVLKTVKAAVDGRLRLYPNAAADALRGKLAKLHGCSVQNLIVGNGCDELLALAVRAFVDTRHAQRMSRGGFRALVQYFTPSYSLYPILAEIHDAPRNPVPLEPDFRLPSLAELKRSKTWDFHAALTFITTPNAPSGRGYPTRELETLGHNQRGVVLLDETYADFASENALSLGLKYPHILVARSFSKAYSLCFQRIGYCVGHPELIKALHKIRDSYNVNGLGQIAAEATLDDLDYYRANLRRIIETREWLGRELTKLGCRVLPSQTNFLFLRPPRVGADVWLRKLRDRKILVRWFSAPEIQDYLRITVGTRAEAEVLLEAVAQILRG